MHNNDKGRFSDMLSAFNKIYHHKEMNSDEVGIWWWKLKMHEWDEVTKAFDQWSSNMRTMPTPSDITTLIRSAKSYRMLKLEKPKVNMVHAKEKLRELKEKFGWKK